jgi:hypothetical protein
MTAEHDLPIVRACQIARLSRAAYYKPGIDRMARDAEVITALQAIVVNEQRWGFGSVTIACVPKAIGCSGRVLRTLNVIDEASREALGTDIAVSAAAR